MTDKEIGKIASDKFGLQECDEEYTYFILGYKEAQDKQLRIGGVTKRITEAKNKRLECGCDSGGSYMYYDEEGGYIKIEDVIELINTIE